MENQTSAKATAGAKTEKYLKYAIGEIILVVMGILIALSINNWNEGKKELKEENKLLSNLRSEFVENKKSLDSTLNMVEMSIASMYKLLNLIGREIDHEYKGDKLDSLLAKCLDNPYWDRTEFVLKDLKNSGRLSKLSNEKLKSTLYKWSKLNSSIADKDEDANFSYLYFLNYLKANASLRQIDNHFVVRKVEESNLAMDNSILLSDIKFENATDDLLIYLEQRRDRFIEAKSIINEIIEETNN